MDEDPRALMTLVGLSPLRKWTVAKRLGRMLEEENAMNSQNLPSKLATPSDSSSKKAAKDTKTIQKWWKKAQPKSSRKGRTSLDRRADLDDEEGVGLIVAYIVRQAFGDLLDFLGDDPSFGLDPDEDDVPRDFVSVTTKWKKYPAIFKGDEPVRVQEADFYTARKILYPSDDDED